MSNFTQIGDQALRNRRDEKGGIANDFFESQQHEAGPSVTGKHFQLEKHVRVTIPHAENIRDTGQPTGKGTKGSHKKGWRGNEVHFGLFALSIILKARSSPRQTSWRRRFATEARLSGVRNHDLTKFGFSE